jgi:drug/metabolite transporter (DMT)-like permease
MVTVRDSSGADGHESSIGDLMTLVSAMLYAVYTVACVHFAQNCTTESATSTIL